MPLNFLQSPAACTAHSGCSKHFCTVTGGGEDGGDGVPGDPGQPLAPESQSEWALDPSCFGSPYQHSPDRNSLQGLTVGVREQRQVRPGEKARSG